MFKQKKYFYFSLFLVFFYSTSFAADSNSARTETFSTLPNWSGYWVIDTPLSDVGVDGYPENFNFQLEYKLMGFTAPYNEETMNKLPSLMGEMQRSAAQESASGWGYPLMMEAPTPFQFLITPEETTFINFYREIRHIYTDGREFPAAEDLWPTPWGDSIGHWEGDTLVIETIAVARPGIFFFPMPLVSEQARYIERITMTGPNQLESEFTIIDPASLNDIWVVNLTYKRADMMDKMFHMPFDNDRSAVEDGFFTISNNPQ